MLAEPTFFGLLCFFPGIEFPPGVRTISVSGTVSAFFKRSMDWSTCSSKLSGADRPVSRIARKQAVERSRTRRIRYLISSFVLRIDSAFTPPSLLGGPIIVRQLREGCQENLTLHSHFNGRFINDTSWAGSQVRPGTNRPIATL